MTNYERYGRRKNHEINLAAGNILLRSSISENEYETNVPKELLEKISSHIISFLKDSEPIIEGEVSTKVYFLDVKIKDLFESDEQFTKYRSAIVTKINEGGIRNKDIFLKKLPLLARVEAGYCNLGPARDVKGGLKTSILEKVYLQSNKINRYLVKSQLEKKLQLPFGTCFELVFTTDTRLASRIDFESLIEHRKKNKIY